MSKKKPDPNPADLEAYKAFQSALSAVLTFPEAVIVPRFMTINIKRPIHDNSGNEIPAQLHFVDENGAIYAMTIEGKTETGLKGQLVRYNSTTGGAFTLSNLIGLILADKALAPLIDADAARAALDALGKDAKRSADEAAEILQIPAITATRAEIIEYPLDNVNSKIWTLLEKDTGGQIALKAEKTGSERELNIYYAINFDELGEDISITKRLTPFDKRVYIAVSALFNAGNKTVTLTQIYYAMGYTGKPGKSDLERINSAITKMNGAKIYVNNEQEAAAYKYNKFIYDGSLLPLERGTALINGQLSDAAIHLFREPPVISFAKQRKQITTINVRLLQSPISKTDANLLLEDYLIDRIAKAKNGKGQRRILFKTLWEKAGASTVKQRQRMPAKVERYLKHYQACGMIQAYTIEPDGITFYFSATV